MVRRRTYNDSYSSHLCIRSDQDESGTTPARFPTECFYNEDLPLRQTKEQPGSSQQANMQTSGHRANKIKGVD